MSSRLAKHDKVEKDPDLLSLVFQLPSPSGLMDQKLLYLKAVKSKDHCLCPGAISAVGKRFARPVLKFVAWPLGVSRAGQT